MASDHNDLEMGANEEFDFFKCLKPLGERTMAKDFERQNAEVQMLIALLNRFNAVRTPQIIRMR